MSEKIFYYAMNNDAYVVMPEEDYNTVNELIDMNAEVLDAYDENLIAEIPDEFYIRERQIQKLLNMTDDEFAMCILY